MSAQSEWLAIPTHLRPGLARYLVHGVRPGGFLRAFIDNDLLDAVCRAADATYAGFRPMAVFLVNYAPRGSYGRSGCCSSWLSINHASRVEIARRYFGDAFPAMVADSGIQVEEVA